MPQIIAFSRNESCERKESARCSRRDGKQEDGSRRYEIPYPLSIWEALIKGCTSKGLLQGKRRGTSPPLGLHSGRGGKGGGAEGKSSSREFQIL